MPLQFPNFEKCHCNFQTLKNATAIFANFEKRHCSLQTLKNATPDFENANRNGMKWHFSKFGNCSGISRIHQIWSGIYQINPKQK